MVAAEYDFPRKERQGMAVYVPRVSKGTPFKLGKCGIYGVASRFLVSTDQSCSVGVRLIYYVCT